MAATAEDRTQQQILDIIVHKDDVSWKQVIFGLIEEEQMDPWDINLSLLSQKFLQELKKLKEMDFRISGKVVLASAILLKMKAEKLQDEEMAALDSLIHSVEEPVDLGLDTLDLNEEGVPRDAMPKLVPRTPQPRRRRVSLYELVEALEQALETESKRPPITIPRVLDTIEPPRSHVDISEVIMDVFDRVHEHYVVNEAPAGSLLFHTLARSSDPRDLVMTFIPLLHLENARKVSMEQQEHFGPINVHLLDATPPAASIIGDQSASVTSMAAKKAPKKKDKLSSKAIAKEPVKKDIAPSIPKKPVVNIPAKTVLPKVIVKAPNSKDSLPKTPVNSSRMPPAKKPVPNPVRKDARSPARPAVKAPLKKGKK